VRVAPALINAPVVRLGGWRGRGMG
jgi:hypothetical protein